MICGGPGFLALAYDLAPRPPPPPTYRKTEKERLADKRGRGGESWGGAKSYNHKEAWSSINHSVFSRQHPPPRGSLPCQLGHFQFVRKFMTLSGFLPRKGGQIYWKKCKKLRKIYLESRAYLICTKFYLQLCPPPPHHTQFPVIQIHPRSQGVHICN